MGRGTTSAVTETQGGAQFVSGANGAADTYDGVNTATATFDLTASQVIDCRIQFGTSNANNTITMRQLTVSLEG